MPNANYLRGVRWERKRQAHYRDTLGCQTMRASGSHGLFDLVAITPQGGVELIQCKVIAEGQPKAMKMIEVFKKSPPLGHREKVQYHQGLEIWSRKDRMMYASYL